MNEHIESANPAAEVIDCARAAENAIQRLCRATLARPSMTPAEVDVVLAHLATAAGAIPQAARQLSDILEQAKDDHVLEMDTLGETEDPDLAIDTARLHLDAVREPALDLHRHLDAAHNETAHIATAGIIEGRTERDDGPDIAPRVHRPEDHQPPRGAGGIGPDLPR